MPLNKQAGNMYDWCTHTFNIIKGECPHDCIYCYMKKFKVGELRFDKKELEVNLGSDKTIFMGSSTDMFATAVPKEWIAEVIAHCMKYPDNVYLFQTKNPARFHEFINIFPKNSILGTTIETNRENKFSKAPSPSDRALSMRNLNFDKMISIEPIMDFDLPVLVGWIKFIDPKFVSIGADSKCCNLPEPMKDKIKELLEELEDFTEVKPKSNLARLIPNED